MNDILPDITINVDCNAREFIERMERILLSRNDYGQITKNCDIMGDKGFVRLDFIMD